MKWGRHCARNPYSARARPDTRVAVHAYPPLARQPVQSPPPPSAPIDMEPERIGPYRILELLGRGGMGSVYRALTPSDEPVALKIIRDDLLHEPEVRRRFSREARAAARLEHPHITRLLDFGTDAGKTYMAMELVIGGTLSDWRENPPDGETLKTVFVQLFSALGYAHARGVVHRDLKPDNVLLGFTDDGSPVAKVMDFGVAHFRDEVSVDSDVEQTVIGTPTYMSPEQALGAVDITPATDIYAMGVMLFELITGGVPFEGKSIAGTLFSHIRDPIPKLKPRRGYRLSGPWDDVVSRLLAKHPAARYMFAIDARRALKPCLIQGTGGPGTGSYGAVGDSAPSFDTTVRPRNPATTGEMVAVEQAAFTLFGFREPPFQGRQPELRALRDAVSDTLRERSVRVIVLSGDMGVGKTRLVTRVREVVEESGLMQGWFGSYDENSVDTDEGVRDAVQRGLGLLGLNHGDVAQRIDETLTRQDYHDRWEHQAMLEYLGPPSPGVEVKPLLDRETTRWALVERILRRAASDRPVMFVVEDIHQSDGGPIRFIEWLLSSSVQAFPCLVVLTTRPEMVAPGTPLGASLETQQARPDGRLHAIKLDRLPLVAMQRLVTQSVPMPADVASAVAMRAGGNPQFAVELVRHLVDSGRLEGFGEQPTVDEVLAELPNGVGDILKRRLIEASQSAEADANTLDVWERIAILGSRISFELALEMLRIGGVRDALVALDRALTAGVAAAILVEDAGGIFRFESAMLRQALIERVATAGRAVALETAAAHARTRVYPGATLEQSLEIARHFERAGDAFPAVSNYLAYAKAASRAERPRAAIDAYLSAATILNERFPDLVRERIDCELGLAESYLQLASYDDARGRAIEARRLSAQLPHGLTPARATHLLAKVAHRVGNNREARVLYMAAIDGFTRESDPLGRAYAELGMGALDLRDGRIQEAEATLRGCRLRFEELGDDRGKAECLSVLGRAALDTGLHEEAARLATDARNLYQSSGQRHGSAVATLLQGEILLASREHRSAVTALDRARDELLAVGDAHSAAKAILYLGMVADATGDAERALNHYREAADNFEHVGDRQYAAITRLARGRVEADTGSWERADSSIMSVLARDQTERIDDSQFIALLVDVARLAIFAGRNTVAQRLLKTADLKLTRIAHATALYDRVDEVKYLLHELTDNEETGESSDAVIDLFDDFQPRAVSLDDDDL